MSSLVIMVTEPSLYSRLALRLPGILKL